ncbi:sigma-70 family RNA polymerase sigma factor [Flaviramulus sp. BrNp1-15]|uniref:RNA polymerase sigma factor n=1 Tax=Flaviramulus sp. BrNp1-15 TaxID=2916754 RepID=UPI001EE7C6A2|nr:sigma-70 family RNA polymerase sigma factor [Flaviramulus sp. BrNp1-15]ULC58520.1 sigma-70 family RNA polymerase sigma factor [Flaviramulus sp. BrNp1-15]
MTDEQLVQRITENKDAKLFEVLYDKFSKKVYNMCYGFARDEDEAKDLTQDVFLKLYVKLPSFKGASKFSTWLYSLTYNHCVNYVNRNTAKKIEKHTDDYYSFQDLEEEETDNSIFQTKVKKLNSALELISPEEKTILFYKYQDNLPIKKIEQVLGIGESAVKMRIKRAKDKLTGLCA